MLKSNKKMGNKIRIIRRKRGLNLADLAQRIDKSPSYLSMVERGLTEPSIKALIKISEELDVPKVYFLIDEQKYRTLIKREFHNI